MGSGTVWIVRSQRGAAALLNSVSRTTLAALSLGLALGIALPREARAIDVSQSSTYFLSTSPVTFDSKTDIDALSPSTVGVFGNSLMPWHVANYGSIQAPFLGIEIASAGSAVTNWGAISGKGIAGVLLENGGAVTNQSGGSISGRVGAASITGRAR